MASIHWILLADRSRARLLHALPDGLGPFPSVADFVHEAGRLQASERYSDQAGRVDHPAGWRSALEPDADRDSVEAGRFAAELVDHLERSSQERRFDDLTVIAPPKFLGALRAAWTPQLKQRIQAEFDQNLIPLPEPELQRRLEELMTELAAARSGSDQS